MNKKVTLPSGAELEIQVAPFGASKALYQAVVSELRGVELDVKLDLQSEVNVDLLKNLFCAALDSKRIETALDECMKVVLYNGLKIDKSTFEPLEARDDYFTACFEVAQENIRPFTKSLFAQFSAIFQSLQKSPA